MFDAGDVYIEPEPYVNHGLFSGRVLERGLKRSRALFPEGLGDELPVSARKGDPRPVLELLGYRLGRAEQGCDVMRRSAKGKPYAVLVTADPEDLKHAACLLLAMKREGARWGVLSDGRRWRLYREGLPGGVERYFEVKPKELDVEGLKVFANVFGNLEAVSRRGFADRLWADTSERVAVLKSELRDRARMAAAAICRGFYFEEQKTTGAVPTPEALEMIYKHALILIHRLVFIYMAENAGVLPGEGERYRTECGLCGLSGRVDDLLKKTKNKTDLKYTIWDSLRGLFECLHHGDEDLQIPCQGSVLMDPNAHPFLQNNRVPDRFFAEAILNLSIPGGGSNSAGGGYAELDAADVVEALSPLTGLRPVFAEDPMVLVESSAGEPPVWMPKKLARWKKVLVSVSRGEIYLEEIEAPAGKPAARDVAELYAYSLLACGGGGAMPMFLPESGPGHALVRAADTAALVRAAESGGDYNSILLELMQRVYVLDSNPLNIDLARLGAWLLTMGDKPPIYLEHNIRVGNALCGAMPGDVEGIAPESDYSVPKLRQWAHEVAQVRNRSRGGLAGVRACESGFRKIERRIEAAHGSPDFWVASGLFSIEKFRECAVDLERERECMPLIGESRLTVHLPARFPEVFYSEERYSGFRNILLMPTARRPLTGEERVFLRRRIGQTGVLSVSDAAVRRYLEILAPGGSMGVLVQARFLKSARAKALTAWLNRNADILETGTEKLIDGYVMIRIIKK